MHAPLPIRAAAVLAAVAMVVAGCSGDSSDSDEPDSGEPDTSASSAPSATAAPDPPAKLRSYYQQNLEWESCEQGECATAKVPVDYAAPNGATTEIELARRPADNPDERIGTLFLNPGGPGGSGIEYLTTFASEASDDILEHYDLVGFDPRGVASSDPVNCVSDARQDEIVASDPDPDTPTEMGDLVATAKTMGKGCVAKSGALAKHMSTIEVAKDLDVLRALVGGDRLSYVGASYGTFIGATYAELFPKRVGRMVLDGAIDPTLTSREASLAQAKGFERALRAYVTDCVSQGSTCPLGDGVDAGMRRIDDFLQRLEKKPLDTGDEDRPLTRSLASYGIAVTLYNKDYWTALSGALSRAFDGDGSALLQLSDAYFRRTPDGYANNQFEAQTVVNCLDEPSEATPAEVRRGVDEFERAAPVFGEFLAWGELTCASWPIEPSYKPLEIDGSGAAPIVVVGTTRDPATPYRQAVALAEQLESGVLLTREGDGHTAYHRGNECIDDALDGYLLQGEVPEDGMRC